MKLLHCADLHLDSPLRGLARREEAPVEALRGATRRAFERAVDVALDEQVAAVVIAGDLYDGNRDDYQTAMFLQRQLHRLRDAAIAVVIAYGNHDAESEITRRLSLPDKVSVLPSAAAATVVLEDVGLAVHGRSYATRSVDEDLTVGYPAPVAGLFNVGVLHTSLDGRPGHARYAPCTPDGLVRRGYQYWALGHVHRREELHRDGVTAVFPGNICGRDVGETGSKGATLVEYDGDRLAGVVHRELAPVRWHRLAVDASHAASADEVGTVVVEQLQSVRDAAPGVLHAVRLAIAADRRAFGRWAQDPEQWEAQLRSDAAGGDEAVWLERIEVRPPPSPPEPVADDALAAVAEVIERLHRHSTGSNVLDELLAGVRARFGAEREVAVALGARGLDETSFPEMVAEAEALLRAELEAGA